jgi:hypothetical protein
MIIFEISQSESVEAFVGAVGGLVGEGAAEM